MHIKGEGEGNKLVDCTYDLQKSPTTFLCRDNFLQTMNIFRTFVMNMTFFSFLARRMIFSFGNVTDHEK